MKILSLRAAAAAALSLGVLGVHAQGMYFSGPSVARSNVPATFQGGNFAANLPVTVVVSSPGGVQSAHGAVAGADGKLRFDLLPNQGGTWRLVVTSTAGKPLASATLVANP